MASIVVMAGVIAVGVDLIGVFIVDALE